MIFGPILTNVLFIVFGVIKPAFGCIKSLEEDYSENWPNWLSYCFVSTMALQMMNILQFMIPFYEDVRLLLVVVLGWNDARGAYILYTLFIRRKLQKVLILAMEAYDIIKNHDFETMLLQNQKVENKPHRYSTYWAFSQWKSCIEKKITSINVGQPYRGRSLMVWLHSKTV